MAKVMEVIRTCGLLLCFPFLSVSSATNREKWIESISVINKSCYIDGNKQDYCKYILKVEGGEFLGHLSWSLTSIPGAKGTECVQKINNYELKELKTTQSKTEIELAIPAVEDKVYFCLYISENVDKPLKNDNIYLNPKLDLQILKTSQEKLGPSGADDGTPTRIELLQGQTPIREEQVLAQETNEVDGILKQSEEWSDISHDIDVNYKPEVENITRPEDIELVNSKDSISPLADATSNSENTDVERSAEPSKEVTDEFDSINPIEVFPDDGIEVFDVVDPFNDTLKEIVHVKVENGSVGLENIEVVVDEMMANNFKSMDDLMKIVGNNTLKTVKRRHIRPPNNEINDNTDSESGSSSSSSFNTVKRSDPVDFSADASENLPLKIIGFTIENADKEPYTEDGITHLLAETRANLRAFGTGFTMHTSIALSLEPGAYGDYCTFLKKTFTVKELYDSSAIFEIVLPDPTAGKPFYICAVNSGEKEDKRKPLQFVHQGSQKWLQIQSFNKLLPMWVSILLIFVCLIFSALFSGLNLGLMSLDRTELKIISNTGTEKERGYARTIMPVRDHGNYLLCSILLGNVAVNSTFTILLDDLTTGLFAVIFSTLAIVLLGEITPQAICSRHGLAIGAKTIYVTKGIMLLTFPLSYPVSIMLNKMLGEEIGNVYNRERLKELVKVTNDINDLDKDEVNIISGALEMRQKQVREIMTKIEDVFMLPIDSVLDFETVSEIMKSGFSRIPVYEGTSKNIVTVLFIKDLAFVDPDDNTPLKTLCQFYQNVCNFVFEDVTLDVMFRQFKEGHKGHMAFVHRVNNEGEGDPFYETVGLVTLEDVIEELIQAEIVDETDVFTDNRTKRRRNRPDTKLQNFGEFAGPRDNQRIRISPQLTLATFQFLTAVDPFRSDQVSETILRRLLRQDIINQIKCKGKDKLDPSTLVFEQGKPVDYFVLILEGRVEVTVGREKLVFESGPFTYFGVQALTQNVGVAESPTMAPSALGSLQNINMDAMLRYTFVPDYSVRATTDLLYITIKRSLYLAAKRATLMEKTSSLSRGNLSSNIGEQFDNEVEKLLHPTDEEGCYGDRKTPVRQISPNQLPASASPVTRSSFTTPPSNQSSPQKNGNVADTTYKFPPPETCAEQEKDTESSQLLDKGKNA